MDSWSHYHRRAAALAEIFAIALRRPKEAAELLEIARNLPKGFAGFRALSALTLAESTRIATQSDRDSRDAALTSAIAASHRIQDHRFCYQMTAMVNAMRSKWVDIPAGELEAIVDRFLKEPLHDEFCTVHRVLEDLEYRAKDQDRFQALPIPEAPRQARSLREIAGVFDRDLRDVVKVNAWVWSGSDSALEKDAEVNVPDPEFIPILAARFAAEALVAEGLSAETRSRNHPTARADGAPESHRARYGSLPSHAFGARRAKRVAAVAEGSSPSPFRRMAPVPRTQVSNLAASSALPTGERLAHRPTDLDGEPGSSTVPLCG